MIVEERYCSVWADVKRKASPEVLKEVGALMKLYQEEVDKLSNRYTCRNSASGQV